MSYRTKRPSVRSILTFGVGVTLAITQLGAGCVPANPSRRCTGADGSADDAGECVDSPSTADGGGDSGNDGK